MFPLKVEQRMHIFIIVILVLFIGLGVYFIRLDFQYPYWGLSVDREQSSDEYYITRVEHEAWGMELGVKIGDKILEVDGQPINEHKVVRKFEELEFLRQLKVERQGEVLEFTLPKDTSLFHNRIYGDLIGWVICYAAAIIVYVANINRKDRSNQILVFFLLVMGTIYLCQEASSRGNVLSKYVASASFKFFPVFFLHYFYLMLESMGKVRLPRVLFRKIYEFLLVLTLFNLSYFTSMAYEFLKFERVFILLWFLFGILACLVMLIYAYIKHRKQMGCMMKRVRYMIIILVISFLPIVLFYVMPKLLFGKEIVTYLIAKLSLLLFPIGLTCMTLLNYRKHAGDENDVACKS